MIKSYHDEIMKMYENIRDEEINALKKRKLEIQKKVPSVTDIENKIGLLCIQLSKTIFKSSENREELLKKLKYDITELRVKKSELLVQHGYPVNYLDLHYRCSKCKDTGYVENEKCICYKQKLVKLYYKNSELENILKVNNFNFFNYNYFSAKRAEGENESPRKKIEKNVQMCLDFIKKFNSSDENLLFYGSPGTGKTFLSCCIAKELLDKGNLVIYRTSESLIDDLRKIRFSNEQDLAELITDCDLLIIDDLGAEQISDFSRTELFNILNKKLLKHKKMLISTNLSLEDIMKIYSDRITSRLIGEFKLCKFIGEDIRIKKNLNSMEI